MLSETIADGSDHPRVHLYYALAERERGNLATAADVLRRALERPSDLERELGLELAVTLSWDGKATEAREVYESVLARHPGDHAARMGRARMFGWEGRHRDARRAFEQLLEDDPKDVEALLGLASVEAASGRRGKAFAAYDRALELDPDNLEARKNVTKLEEQPRFSASAGAGYANVAGVHHAGQAELDVAFEARSWSTIIAGYASSVMRFDDPTSGDAFIQQHVGRAGVAFNIRHRLYIVPEYQALVTSEAHHHGLSLGVAVVAADWLTVSGAARPGVWSDGHLDVLTRVSVEAKLGRRVRPSGHWYYYRDPDRGAESNAVVGKLTVDVVKRLSLTAGGGWQYDRMFHGAIGLGQVDVTMTDRFGLYGRYEVSTGAFVRQAATAGVRMKL